jgi:CBS domain-containing protein
MSAELQHIRVHDVMHIGILSCSPDASLEEVAGIMAQHHVHFVAVVDGSASRPTAVLSDLDLIAAIASHARPTAFQSAATEPLAVSADERLDRAAQLMAEHSVSHLLVLDAADGHPVGVLSTLDIADTYAGAEIAR